MADFSDLIARLEKATGPCRKLDLAISFAVNYREAFTGAIRAEWSVMADEINVYDATGRRCILDPAQFVPQWTRSLDAAVSLVPEGWSINLNIFPVVTGGEPFTRCFINGHALNAKSPGSAKGDVDFNAPALALCIAALKARMQGGE